MKDRLIKIKAELLVTANNFEKQHIPYILSAVEDLKSSETSIKFNELFFENITCRVSYKIPAKEVASRFSDVVTIEISSEIPVKALHYQPHSFRTKREFWSHMRSELEYEYFLEIKRLIILSHIAFPGALKSYGPLITTQFKGSKKKEYKSYTLFSLHREVLDDTHELGWPVFKKVSLKKVLKWFYENKMTFKEISNSPISRVINAYSRLFVERIDDDFQLIWALLALEVLYCTKKNASNWQITTKSQKLLGDIDPGKLNRLEDMYRFRSKFIHGEIDIPPVDFEPEDIDMFEERMYKATALSIAILTATLQEIVLRNITDLPIPD